MSVGPVRSEAEGGFSAPANVISDSSLDCGCKQFPCPKLAKYATRKMYLACLCLIGVVQGAAHVYLHVTSPTISRKFKFHPTGTGTVNQIFRRDSFPGQINSRGRANLWTFEWWTHFSTFARRKMCLLSKQGWSNDAITRWICIFKFGGDNIFHRCCELIESVRTLF